MDRPAKIRTRDLAFSYNGKPVLRNTTEDFREKSITAIVGPSGCGKSTLLSTINRLWEEIPGASMQGTVEINLDGAWRDIYAGGVPAVALRRRVGMVFQSPNPLPMSVFRNVAFPLVLAGVRDRELIRHKVEEVLRKVRLWKEVDDRLADPALSLSGGQQQRMCIARAMILEPEILLLDEPTSSLDHATMEAIERLFVDLKERCTLLVVSHYLDQVRRIADRVVELQGEGTFRIDSGRRGGIDVNCRKPEIPARKGEGA